MKLKSLELFGFKSFVDKTLIHFDAGITGVVGPNGCGKSNIVDAIRWAMGEQSAKHLRGNEMQDVIFNGSSRRNPLGMSQVILTFDLSDGRGPAAYSDYSEIQVERRLYRSGESEYSINKIPCRLRDVIDLFLGTGVGTKAYSIVEQGQIDRIISSKPEDRRLIIEEAAGISKFKNRKETALRKIQSTEANLERLRDVIGEIKRQMNSLNRQAGKAERYREYFDELKTRELRLASIRYKSLREEMDSLRKGGGDFSERETSLAARLSEIESGSEAKRLELAEAEREIGSVQEKYYIQQNAVKLHETTLEYQASKLKDLAKRAESYSEEIELFQSKRKHSDEEIERLNQVKVKVDITLATAGEKIRETEEALRQASKVCEEWKKSAENSGKEILNSVSQVAETQSHLEYLDRHEVEIDGRVAKGQTEIDGIDRVTADLNAKISKSDHQLEGLKQLGLKLSEEIAGVQQELDENLKNSEETAKRLETLLTGLAGKQSRLQSLKEIHEDLEGYKEGVRTVLKASREDLSGVCGPVSQIIDTRPEYEPAVNAILGEKLQYVVVQSQEEGVSAMGYLRKVAKGRSTFVPLNIRSDSLRKEIVSAPGVLGPLLDKVQFSDDYKQIAHYLFADCILVEDLKQALHVWSQESEPRTYVTLEGEVIDRAGLLSGGGGPENESLLGHKRRIEELQKEIALSKASVTETKKDLERLKKSGKSLAERLDHLSQNTHGEEIRQVQQERDGSRLREELARFGQDRNRLSLEIARALDEKNDLKKERDSVVLKLDEVLARQQALEEESNRAQSEFAKVSEGKDRLSHELMGLKGSLEQAADRAENSGRELEQWINTKLELQEGIEKRVAEINLGQSETRALTQAQVAVRVQLNEALKEMDHLGGLQKELRIQFDSQSEQIREKEMALREIRREHEEALKLLHANDLKLSETGNQLQFLADQILERYKVDISHLVLESAPPEEVIDLEEERRQVEELKEKLEKIGSVHVGAIEELNELKERHDFLSKQSEDLTLSLETLKKAIQKINRVSRERFLKTFELVNEKFTELFPRLFKGGKARLILVDEQNLLETGVEIHAQPPGKKLQSISLLSGGEKALTAVALIFSIFLIKPSPFCLLDEVDAPLDDVNIDRFNELVQEMTKLSQFIVITHNKRTMEKTDGLYGITMEEAGVSKVVSVRLGETSKEPLSQVA